MTVNVALAAELVALIARDDDARVRLAADGTLHDGYHPTMEAVHRANAARLRELVDANGWPGRAQVGAEAASAAWRIVQHAIGEPVFLRAMLPLLAEAAARGDVELVEVAMLDDRIRVFEGRLQRYGTQYDWSRDGETLELMIGVEEPDTVDARRAAIGLPPLAWRRPPPPGERPPSDPAARARDAEAWARAVGWR